MLASKLRFVPVPLCCEQPVAAVLLPTDIIKKLQVLKMTCITQSAAMHGAEACHVELMC